jgi:hypothetical protein
MATGLDVLGLAVVVEASVGSGSATSPASAASKTVLLIRIHCQQGRLLGETLIG